MRPPTFYGAFSAPHDGRCMMTIGHQVERRIGTEKVAGAWRDVWCTDGLPHASSADANKAAVLLRVEGFTVRVRPVFV